MLEIISGVMFGLGLAMFEWGLSQRNYKKPEKKKKVYVQRFNPIPVANEYEEALEDLMYDTGMSEDELDEIMPDIGRDIEDFI